MPLYVFTCKVCEAEEEVLQKYTDPAPAACMKCGAADSMEREVARTSFQLKGDGWAKDGYTNPHSQR